MNELKITQNKRFERFVNEDKRDPANFGFNRTKYYTAVWINKKEKMFITKKDQIVIRLIHYYLNYIKKSATMSDLKDFLKEKMNQPSYSPYHLKYILMFLRFKGFIRMYNKEVFRGVSKWCNVYKWNKRKKRKNDIVQGEDNGR